MYVYMYEFLADNEEQVPEFSQKFNRRNQQSGTIAMEMEVSSGHHLISDELRRLNYCLFLLPLNSGPLNFPRLNFEPGRAPSPG
jgi:hypothetical protein